MVRAFRVPPLAVEALHAAVADQHQVRGEVNLVVPPRVPREGRFLGVPRTRPDDAAREDAASARLRLELGVLPILELRRHLPGDVHPPAFERRVLRQLCLREFLSRRGTLFGVKMYVSHNRKVTKDKTNGTAFFQGYVPW